MPAGSDSALLLMFAVPPSTIYPLDVFPLSKNWLSAGNGSAVRGGEVPMGALFKSPIAGLPRAEECISSLSGASAKLLFSIAAAIGFLFASILKIIGTIVGLDSLI